MSRTPGRAFCVAAATVATAVLGMALPAIAAQPQLAPPGNPAVNQYTETFPSAEGPRLSSAARERASEAPGALLSRQGSGRLQEQGPRGGELLELVAATAPTGGKAPREDARSAGASSPTAAVVGQALGTSDSGGLGLLLPAVLLATLAWSLASLWRRRAREE
jgi:hypothetical protein